MALIEAEHVHKTYRLGRVGVPVLRGVSLRVEKGEWLAVLGASGSGKSTLLHILGGLDQPDTPRREEASRCACGQELAGVAGGVCPSCNRAVGPAEKGVVRFEGRALHDLPVRRLDQFRRTNVGFVFQFYHLLPELSVLENVLIGAMIAHGRLGYMARAASLRTRAAELLERAGLSHRLAHKPSELSGGERQRVAIARALMNQPVVLMADEPTGNLDRVTGGTILDLFSELHRQGQTMIVVTHDEATAKRADRLIRLEDGKVVA